MAGKHAIPIGGRIASACEQRASVIFIDTNVAIDLRDNVTIAGPRLEVITPSPLISLITLIELEGGVERHQDAAPLRRRLLEIMLREVDVVMFTRDDVSAYGAIVATCGFDRRRTLDRLIAAQALSRGASLITANTSDFADIPKLQLIVW